MIPEPLSEIVGWLINRREGIPLETKKSLITKKPSCGVAFSEFRRSDAKVTDPFLELPKENYYDYRKKMVVRASSV